MPEKCVEVRRDVERDAVERDPAAHAHADRRDLVLGRRAVEPAGLSGRMTQTPTRSSRVAPSTPNARSVSISQPSSEAT